MSKVSLDSDLYGDIYGDEEQEAISAAVDRTQDASGSGNRSSPSEPEPPSFVPPADSPKPISSSVSAKELPASLPPKPTPQTLQASPTLSYSAQIAQQFSTYRQTPSQERQQRPNHSHSQPATSGFKTDTSDSVFGKKPSEMHDAGKLFIGGLSWDTTDEGLRDHFQEFGKVDACTIMRDPNGTSRGFAFLTFKDPSVVDTVVGRDHFLDGKAIDPKRAIPREEHLRNTRFFVGGLAMNTNADSMREFFSNYGTVVDATVMMDRETGRSKGFGFVTFEDFTGVDLLVGKNLTLDDKQIEVKMAQPRSQQHQARSANNSPNPSSRDGIYSNDPSRPSSAPISFMTPQQPQMPMVFQRPAQMMGGAVPMMNMNPMGMAMNMGGMSAGMNVGMGAFGPVNLMGQGTVAQGMMPMNAMSMMGNMNGMGGMGSMGALRLGMGPIGAAPTAMMGIMGRPGVRVNPGGMGRGIGQAPTQNAGVGPSRVTTRGQHSFHPYAR